MTRRRAAWGLVALVSFPFHSARVAAEGTTPHVQVQEAMLLGRYRFTETGAHVRTANQLEDKIAFRARLNADRKGRVSLQIGVLSGPTLTGSWNNTGAGMGSRTFDLAIRQLYVTAVPIEGIEAQVGSLYPLRGENTEVTAYDNDAYLTGERVMIRRPRWLFVDALSASRAYFGDPGTANAFERLDRLSESNYLQVLAQKTFAHHVATSLDWTNAPGGATWRGGVRLPVIDKKTSLRVEAYLRSRDERGGAGVSVDRALGRVTVTLGYASIDSHFLPVNGDRYRTGERVFAGVNVPMTAGLAASVFYTPAFHEDFPVPVGRRFETLLTYNVLAAIERRRHR
jgi:hypothetical protein